MGGDGFGCLGGGEVCLGLLTRGPDVEFVVITARGQLLSIERPLEAAHLLLVP